MFSISILMVFTSCADKFNSSVSLERDNEYETEEYSGNISKFEDNNDLLDSSDILYSSENKTSTVNVSSVDIYYPTIINYSKKRIELASELGYIVESHEYKYAIKDINFDGTDELVIFDTTDEKIIGAIYTLDGNQPVELYFIGRHGQFSISSDGYFIFSYHNITIYKLVGKELVVVAESDRVNYEDWDNERDNFLRDNKVSTDIMQFVCKTIKI